MLVRPFAAPLILAVLLASAPFLRAEDGLKQWPRFRGPLGTGCAPHADPPTQWSETENVAWKVDLPGVGHSSPIVWGDTVFITVAIRTEKTAAPGMEPPPPPPKGIPLRTADRVYDCRILAFRLVTGEPLWQHSCTQVPPGERSHPDGSFASASPVTDGKRVLAYFGSYGLFCFDLQGKLKWRADVPKMQKYLQFGEGASPALFEDRVVLQLDHQGPSSLRVLDAKTGELVWDKPRPEPSTYATPVVVKVGELTQILTSATGRMRGYDLATGDEIWRCKGMTGGVIPTPISRNGVAYFMSGFRGNSIMAIDLKRARGEITDTDAVLWQLSRNAPYTPSGALLGDRLYYLRTNGARLSCCRADTGEEVYVNERFRDMGTVYASVVGTRDRLYLCGKQGNVVVVKTDDEASLISRNHLDDVFSATPALVGRRLILRGEKWLYCLMKTGSADAEEEGF